MCHFDIAVADLFFSFRCGGFGKMSPFSSVRRAIVAPSKRTQYWIRVPVLLHIYSPCDICRRTYGLCIMAFAAWLVRPTMLEKVYIKYSHIFLILLGYISRCEFSYERIEDKRFKWPGKLLTLSLEAMNPVFHARFGCFFYHFKRYFYIVLSQRK